MKDKILRIISIVSAVFGILGFFGFGLHIAADPFFMSSTPVEIILSAGIVIIAIIAITKK